MQRLCFVAFILLAAPVLAQPKPAAQEKPVVPVAQPSPTGDPRRPAAIEAGDVPVVPAEVTEKLRQYASVRSAAFQGWDPAGKGMLIATRLGNASQLYRVYEPGGRREQVTFFDEPVTGGFLKGGGETILLSMSQGGNENNQVLVLDREKFTTSLLTDGKSRNALQVARDDGSEVLIASNLRNGRDTDLYVANPRKPGSMRLLMQVENEFWNAIDWSLDGKTLLLQRYVSINESYFSLLDVATSKRTDLEHPKKIKASVGAMAFAPSGQQIYLACDVEGEFQQLARYDSETKQYTWLTQDIAWDVEEIDVDNNSGKVAFTINEDGAGKLYVLDGEKRDEISTPLGVISGIEFSPDGEKLGFTLARPSAPADAYSVKIDGGELTRWTYSEVGGVDPSKFVEPTRIAFASFDNREIPAYYFKPKNAAANQRVPVVLMIHGGPEAQYQPTFSSTIQYWVNELGVAVICPNVRGSAGYGKTYLLLDNGPKREDSVKDIGALLDWIAKQPDLDSSRVAVTGGSYGGYMVLASLVHHGTRLRAGIDTVGIANWETFLKNTAPYRRDLRRAEYGDERDPEMLKVFKQISPVNRAGEIKSALMVVHGKNDPRVPFSEAQQIAEIVRGKGKPVWTVYANNEGHGFQKKENVDYLRAVETLFLKQHLQIQ
jgi:dipeptidyl aminopeptidase/acylaminoacyl peptidase